MCAVRALGKTKVRMVLVGAVTSRYGILDPTGLDSENEANRTVIIPISASTAARH